MEKATKNYDAAFEEMLRTKNQYLLDIDSSNVFKDRLYNVHLPALHDDYQVLEHSTTLQMVHSVEKMIGIQKESLEKLQQSVGKAKMELEGIVPERDQEEFVNRYSATKLAAWEVPPDAAFEECAVWHDTVRLTLSTYRCLRRLMDQIHVVQDDFSTTPASTTYLQNVQIKSTSRLNEITPAFETKRRELSGLKNLREAYERDWGLGDTIGVIEVRSPVSTCIFHIPELMQVTRACRISSRQHTTRLFSNSNNPNTNLKSN